MEPNDTTQWVDGVLIEDCIVTGHGSQFFGMGGDGEIRNITVQRNKVYGGWGIFVSSWTKNGHRRTNVSYLDNWADTGVNHGELAQLKFDSVDGLHVHRNTQPTPAGEYGIRALNCTAVDTPTGNTFTGATGTIRFT
jgi:hypothetical protein